MGIKGLSALIKRFAPESVQTCSFEQLKHTTGWYAVDVSGYLYASQYNAEHKGKNNHVRDFFQMISQAAEHHIKLLFIFDGNTRSLAKQHTTEERSNKVSTQKERIRTLLDLPSDRVYSNADLKSLALERLKDFSAEDRVELSLLLRSFIVIQGQFYTDLQHLFERLGVPFLRAQGEADFLCAVLYRAGLIDGVMSEDMDMLTHGVGYLVRGVSSYRGELNTYSLEGLLSGMEISLAQFRELSILCGCDYCPKLEGIAGIRGLTMIKKYGTLGNLLSQQAKLVPPVNFQEEAERAYGIFSTNQEELPSDFSLPVGYNINPNFKSWVTETTGPIANLEGKLRLIAAA
jgi:5'-3' exonuclease